jgi:hypothetical protein
MVSSQFSNLYPLSSIYKNALGFSEVISVTYSKTPYFDNQSETNSFPVLPLTNGLSGLAFAVKIMILNLVDSSFIDSGFYVFIICHNSTFYIF